MTLSRLANIQYSNTQDLEFTPTVIESLLGRVVRCFNRTNPISSARMILPDARAGEVSPVVKSMLPPQSCQDNCKGHMLPVSAEQVTAAYVGIREHKSEKVCIDSSGVGSLGHQ